MKKLLISSSFIALLATSPALAQGSNPEPSPLPRAPAEIVAPPLKPSLDTPDAKGQGQPKIGLKADSAPKTIVSSNAAQMRSTKLVGTNVYNGKNEKIGDVNDILFDETGKVTHVVLGVGGFLGIGEKWVALPFNDLKISRDKSNRFRIVSDLSKEQLKTMKAWEDPFKLRAVKPSQIRPKREIPSK